MSGSAISRPDRNGFYWCAECRRAFESARVPRGCPFGDCGAAGERLLRWSGCRDCSLDVRDLWPERPEHGKVYSLPWDD